jgi:hypothetical protein
MQISLLSNQSRECPHFRRRGEALLTTLIAVAYRCTTVQDSEKQWYGPLVANYSLRPDRREVLGTPFFSGRSQRVDILLENNRGASPMHE